MTNVAITTRAGKGSELTHAEMDANLTNLKAAADAAAVATRVVSATTTATLTVNADTTDVSILTAQVGALTIANPTGTPVSAQPLLIEVKGDGGAISYGTQFVNRGATKPATATAAKWIRIGCEWNASAATWDVIAVIAEA